MQKDASYLGFDSVDFGINSDISVGEDGIHLVKCVFRPSYSFLYVSVSHLTSRVIVKSMYLKVPTNLFYSF